SIKTLLLGTASWSLFNSAAGQPKKPSPVLHASSSPMRSRWDEWPDMRWAGPAFWGNRLQDWRIAGGQLECAVSGPNRSLHCLTHQLGEGAGDFTMRVDLELPGGSGSESDQAGFRIGAQAGDQPLPVDFEDYRRNAVFGEGLHAGIDGTGRLFIGGEKGEETVAAGERIRLILKASEAGGPCQLTLKAARASGGEELARLAAEVDAAALTGNVALLAHFPSGEDTSGED